MIITILRWLGGIFFFILALPLLGESLAGGVPSLLAGALLIPPISRKFPASMSKNWKIGLLVLSAALAFKAAGNLPQPVESETPVTPTVEETEEVPTTEETEVIEESTEVTSSINMPVSKAATPVRTSTTSSSTTATQTTVAPVSAVTTSPY